MRAAIIAWSVSGIRFADVPPSSSIRIVSSTKSGLPSVFSSSVFRSEVESSRSARSASSSSSLSAGASGSSSIAAARSRPPPQPGRMSSSSGRARQRIISGDSLTRSARCSISSSSGSSAQWTSSKTRINGRASASSAAHSRAAHAISCWLRSVSIPSSTPTASASRSATASSPQLGAELRDRLLDRVVVGDPGGDLDHLRERPVGDALAVRQRAADEHRGAFDAFDELAREAALADPGLAVDREQVGALVVGSRARACSRAARARTRGRRKAPPPSTTRPSVSSSLTSRQAISGSPKPFSSTGPTSSVSTAPIVRRRANGPTRISPGWAICCRRAATLTASPVAKVESDSSATTSPASTPILASSPRPCTESRIPAAARMARSASSSCACGMPNAAMTASPANFSTIPPCVVMQCETCSKNELTRRRTISGSLAATNSVEPTRSTNSTVASLRSTV